MLRIVEIKALPNGAHNNQTYPGIVPEGWAIIPADMDTPNYPFGEVETAKIDGVMTVTKWTPGEMPEVAPEETPDPEPTTEEILNAMLGVSE